MIPAWLLWSSVGMLAREVLPESMFPTFGKKAPPSTPRPRGRLAAPPQVAGTRVAAVDPAIPALAESEYAEYVPMDPALPMDAHIDLETERGVLAALEWEDDRQLDGFAQSLSHEGDPYGYGHYPIAASYLRYRAKIIREARQALAQMEAQQATRERIEKGIERPSPTIAAPLRDVQGTTAPAMQAPPPSLQVVPAVRVKIKKSPAGRLNGARAPEAAAPPSSNGASRPRAPEATPQVPAGEAE
jgi:hypothetical protein